MRITLKTGTPEFCNSFPPRKARVHEICGAGALVFASTLAAEEETPVIWISAHRDGHLYQAGAICFLNLQDAKLQAWSMEEALGSGAVGLVICERETPVSFRDMRRLQLAAERGQTTGLLLLSERLASPVAETRWRCEPVYDPKARALQKWSLIKSKQGNLGEWEVIWDDKTHRIALV